MLKPIELIALKSANRLSIEKDIKKPGNVVINYRMSNSIGEDVLANESVSLEEVLKRKIEIKTNMSKVVAQYEDMKKDLVALDEVISDIESVIENTLPISLG